MGAKAILDRFFGVEDHEYIEHEQKVYVLSDSQREAADFARERGYHQRQLRHITHPEQLRGLARGKTLYVLGIKHITDPMEILDLAWISGWEIVHQ